MTQAHLDLHLEPSSSDLTTKHPFNVSPVLFLESLDPVNAHPSEQSEHTTPSKVNTPPDTTHEVAPPPKNGWKL